MTRLRVSGEVERPLALGFDAFVALPGQVPDVGALIPGREGGAVRLGTLLEHAGARPGATHVTLASTDGGFCASVPVAAVREALVTYRLGDGTA